MIEIENIQEIGAGTAIVGLLIAFMLYNKINKIEIGNPIVADITQQIQNGAMAFLNAEYRYLAIFIAVVAALLYVNPDTGWETAVAFLAGAAASVAAGFSGMRAATSANGRTAMAAAEGGQPAALAVSYNGGAVMGLSVGGLGLLGISAMAMWLGTGDAVQNIAGFGMGASSIALFARVGGGIYTKPPMSELTWSERSRQEFPRTILETPASSLTTLAITLEMWQEWEQISSSHS